MASIFDNDEFAGTSTENKELEKALTAGAGVDASLYEGGRALQREDLEATLTNILDVSQNDCKLFHKLNKEKIGSTVHQFNIRTDVGDDEFGFIGEGERAVEGGQEIKRKFAETKYISTKYAVTHQMAMTDAGNEALNSEKVAGVTRITRQVERSLFHGDSSVNPKAFDGLVKMIRDSSKDTDVKEKLRSTRIDIRGLEIGEKSAEIDAGEALFDELAEKVYTKGGDLNKAYFPPILAQQFKRLYNEKLRYLTGDIHTSLTALPDITTAIGSTLSIKGDAGADKMFKVKGKVVASGNQELRPFAPATVTASAGTDSNSQFVADDAGDYMYAVHAVNSYGISAEKAISSPVTVAAGAKVTLEITPASNGPVATGFIITRSKKDGTEMMEMKRIKAAAEGETTYVDLNEDLPGTASIILLSDYTQEMKPVLSFAQLMPISAFELKHDSSLAHRGVIAMYGMPIMRAPAFNAIIDNVGYAGGLY